MMPFFQNDDISINTIIGRGSGVSGDIRVAGFARVDGDIDGDIEIQGKLIIGEKARIRGNVTAKSVMASGIVEGNIVAPDFIKLFATSAVFGDVITHRLEVAEMGFFHGHCVSLKNPETYSAAVSDWQDAKAIRARTPGL